MRALLLILLIFYFNYTNGQTGKGKFKYVDDNLQKNSKTYGASIFYFATGFEFSWTAANALADQNRKINIVSCKGKNLNIQSYLYRDEKNSKDVTTLGIMLGSNYNFILSYKRIFNSDDPKVEISMFYEEDGVLYNYPNKEARTSISGKIYELENYKNGTNNYLQKVIFENGSYLVLKDEIFLYGLKLSEFDCDFIIND
jgi:hypothetical protein